MISIGNILTISSYEAKVLWRNWFFRIVALMGIGFITIFNLAVFSELSTPQWSVLSNSWILPYSTLLMISIPQVAAVIFLATGMIKKDKKLDTNEVFFVRPITNLDYVFGKALALVVLFLVLNLVLLCIPLVVGLTSPFATLNPKAFLIYPLLTTLPSIVFTTGISFLLVTVIRNQPISIVLLIGVSGVQLIYYFDQFSNILDFMAFRLSMLASDITGFVDLEFALWQRAFYFVTGIAFLFITAFALDRLSSHRIIHKATGLIGIGLLVLSSSIIMKVWKMRQEPISLRQEMISMNGKWANARNADVIAHTIDLKWVGDEIISTSDLLVKNNTNEPLDTIFFTLNPGLTVDEAFVSNKSTQVHRTLQILALYQDINLAPGEELKVRIKYHGQITESIAHLEVDQKRYEFANNYMMFSLKKKYSFMEDDYVLLTQDVLWYPDTHVGVNRKAAGTARRSFVNFQLIVRVPPGKRPVSQGPLVVQDDTYHFKPEYPLPQISLVIGDYEEKKVSVAGTEYSIYHHPQSDFFVRHLDQLADTVGHLITDVVNEYEDAQKLSYPFKRLQFVEVPLQFTAYNKIYESHQAFLQPETVFWPEEGGDISQFDFRRQLRDMSRQATQNNQVLTDKQKQANVFNDLIRKVFTKQTGSTWIYEGYDVDNPDYSLFPNYYEFNSGVVSEEWALLNRSIATYLRNDNQTQNDYSRNINGISFAEECNNLMRTSSMNKILTEAPFNKVAKSVSLKSQYLFSYLGQLIGESNFKSFLHNWVNDHQHQLNSYEDFRRAIVAKFGVDIDPIIRTVYSETSQPAFELLDVQKYEVMQGDRKRYQILVSVKNSGDSDGVIEVKFNSRQGNGDEYYTVKVNEEVAEEVQGKLSVVKRGETKLLGYVLDEKPNDIAINTLISKNIPSVITLSVGALSKRETGVLFEGERVIDRENRSAQYEVIVDNEDPTFTHFSPIKPTMLRAYLDSRTSGNQKYYGSWSSSYSKWLATTGSDFYGSVIRSAHFTRSGDGEKIATWTPELKEDGFYDVYVYMRGKNQNEFQGRDGDGKQFTYNYIITNTDGTDHIEYNITNAEHGWNYLGSYYFSKTGSSISLTDECELRTVYADAVKWVKQ
jgi:hypothetical protein